MLGGSQKPRENRLGFHAGSLVITRSPYLGCKPSTPNSH